MSVDSLFTLFLAMLLWAIVPGPGVFAIIARSFSSGVLQGVYMTIGMVIGDYLFIMLAIFGLSAIAEIMGTTFIIIKYLSAAYLIWLGYQLLNTKANAIHIETSTDRALFSNFTAGLFITLGNPKALLFYIGFFPAFVDINNTTLFDVSLILMVATFAFGSVNLTYSLLAVKAKARFKSAKAITVINKTAGTLMITTGSTIALKS